MPTLEVTLAAVYEEIGRLHMQVLLQGRQIDELEAQLAAGPATEDKPALTVVGKEG